MHIYDMIFWFSEHNDLEGEDIKNFRSINADVLPWLNQLSIHIHGVGLNPNHYYPQTHAVRVFVGNSG